MNIPEKKSWLDYAVNNESDFRKVLDAAKIKLSKDVPISQAYRLFTQGDRKNKITILDFKPERDGTYTIAVERQSGPLAGSGFMASYSKEGDIMMLVNKQITWMY